MEISIDRTCTGYTGRHRHIHVCESTYRHTPRTSRKVFHFIRAVSLEIASDRTVRGDEPSAARHVSFFQDTFSRIHFLRPPTHNHMYTHRAAADDNKENGGKVVSLYVWLTAVPRLRIRARYWIPSFFKRSRVVLRLSLFLHVRPISESLSLLPRSAAIISGRSMEHGHMSLYVRMVDERGSPRVSTRRKSEILSLQWPFVFLLSRGIREMDFAMSKTFRCRASRGESRSVTHVSKCLLSTSRECSGKVFRCTEKYFSERYDGAFYTKKKKHVARK